MGFRHGSAWRCAVGLAWLAVQAGCGGGVTPEDPLSGLDAGAEPDQNHDMSGEGDGGAQPATDAGNVGASDAGGPPLRQDASTADASTSTGQGPGSDAGPGQDAGVMPPGSDAGSSSLLDSGISDDAAAEDAGPGQTDAGPIAPTVTCATDPCLNGAGCVDGAAGATCQCQPGFTGSRCETNVNDCAGSPCQNGGSCVDGVDSYSCSCPLGFTGAQCQINIDDCTAGVCLNGGTCKDLVASYVCECPSGYSGTNCQICPDSTSCVTDTDNCAPNPCFNGGACTDGVNSYTCSCPTGYTGARCETDINDCASNACTNGATCIDGVASYTCTCPTGYAGTYCEVNIDDCGSNQCTNGGTCVDGLNSYTCSCPTGFTGTYCQINIDDCPGNQCQNGATCVDGINSYSCTCATGYTGTYCQTNIDDCPGNQCQNGATCVDGLNAYTCNCAAGFTGAYCQTNIDDCVSNQCMNGATCVDGIASYSCTCATGYTGTYCQTNIDDCVGNQCANGAACVDGVNSYSCSCAAGYSGSLCETNIDDCSPNPCKNSGTCTDGVNSYTCTCAIGWSGSTCADVADPCDYHPCQNNGVCLTAGDGINYQCACPNGYTGTLCDTVSAATSCSNLWSSVSTYYSNSVTLGGCDSYPAAREIIASLVNLENQSVVVNGNTYEPCIDFRCDSSYVYLVSTNLPFYDPPSWLPGSMNNPPTTNLIFRVPLTPTAVGTPGVGQYIDGSSLGSSCDDAYQYMVGLTTTEPAQEPYGFCAMSPNATKYFKDGSTYYRRTNCLLGNGMMINGEQIYGSNEAKNGDAWGNPAFYYPDLGTSTELYYKSSSGTQRPGLDFCGQHFHHHGINAACYERDSNREPIHTSYTNADVKGLFNFSEWIYTSGCTDESEIVGWMPDGIPIKGPCVCMKRDADGTCADARHVRSSYVYTGLNAWKGSTSSTSTAASDLANHEGQSCSSDSDCGTSGDLECTWSVFPDASSATLTTVDKRCVVIKYTWCNHIYQDRSALDTSSAGIQYLDRCNGVHSADGYAYHATGSFPYVPSCLKYEPSTSISDITL